MDQIEKDNLVKMLEAEITDWNTSWNNGRNQGLNKAIEIIQSVQTESKKITHEEVQERMDLQTLVTFDANGCLSEAGLERLNYLKEKYKNQ